MYKKLLVVSLIAMLLSPSIVLASAYQLTTGTSIIRTTDGAIIPNDPANSDYQEYVQWKSSGNTPDQPTLSQVQNTKTLAIQAAWQANEQGGFPYLGKTIQSDPINAQRITFASLGAQAAISNNTFYSGSWICTDGTSLPLTAQQTISMAATFAVFGLGVYNHAQELLLKVHNATTVVEVKQIPNW
jgi:hypothetical protein